MNSRLEDFIVFDRLSSLWKKPRTVLARRPKEAVKELLYTNIERSSNGHIIVTGKAGTFSYNADYIDFSLLEEKDV